MNAWTNRRRAWITVIAVIVGMGVSKVAIAHKGLLTLQNDPKQWVMPNGNYSGWNYSALDQINLSNVRNLTMAWSLQLGVLDAHEASPLVIGNTMFIATPDGRQYVAIIGSQLGPNTRVTPDAAADADIRYRRSGATLYVFALPRAVR